MDILKLCRSCMREIVSRERKGFDKRIVDMFVFSTKVMVTEDDKLPKQFCRNCVTKIETTYTFITEVQKVDETLRNFALEIKSNSDRADDKPDSSAVCNFKEETIDMEPLIDFKVSPKIEKLESENVACDIKNSNFIKYEFNDSSPDIKSICTLAKDKNKRRTRGRVKKKQSKTHSEKKNVKEMETVLTCDECAKKFTSKSTYYKHMADVHTIHKFKCEQCPKRLHNSLLESMGDANWPQREAKIKAFALQYELKSHSECHNEKQFPCPTCGKLFKRRMQLKAHAIAHSEIRPYECDMCHMRFKFKAILQNHMRIHSRRKEYLCSVCGISVGQSSNLESHMRVHTGAKPFACSKCDYRSSTSTAMKRHELRHSGVKRHACELCKKTFYDKFQLKRHSRSHTGELPYKCPLCERAFIDSWKRKMHLMRQHNYALADIPRMQFDGQAVPKGAVDG